MTDLQAIASLYEEIDNARESLRGTLPATGKDADPIPRKQQINDQAYSVLAWGQLEADIAETRRDTIRKTQQDDDWKTRRAWALYDPEGRRPHGPMPLLASLLAVHRPTGSTRVRLPFVYLSAQSSFEPVETLENPVEPGVHRSLKAVKPAIHAALQRIKACIEPVKALIEPVESSVDAVKSLIKTCVESVESLLDPVKAPPSNG